MLQLVCSMVAYWLHCWLPSSLATSPQLLVHWLTRALIFRLLAAQVLQLLLCLLFNCSVAWLLGLLRGRLVDSLLSCLIAWLADCLVDRFMGCWLFCSLDVRLFHGTVRFCPNRQPDCLCMRLIWHHGQNNATPCSSFEHSILAPKMANWQKCHPLQLF